MNEVKLSAQIREEIGTNKAKKLRQQHLVPGILYAQHLDKNINLVFNEQDLNRFLQNHDVGATVVLDTGKEEVLAMVRDIQRHHIKRNPLHIDFQALKSDVEIRVTVPFVYTGRDMLKEDLILQELLHGVEIEVLPRYLIERIELDISNAQYGDTMTVAELEISKDPNITVLTDPEEPIYNIIEADVFKEPEGDEDEDAEPALVGKKESEN